MGGGGGNSFYKIGPEKFLKALQEMGIRGNDVYAYESKVNKYLLAELTLYNERKVEIIKPILYDVTKTLSSEIEKSIDLFFGGLIAKHNYIDGLSDIDSLLIFKNNESELCSPKKLMKVLFKLLINHYGVDHVKESVPAVTLKYNGQILQFLPSIYDGKDLKFSDPKGDNWILASSTAFPEKLNKINQDNNNQVVPVIKLVKVIINKLPKKQQISGYHTEALAIEIFENYRKKKTLKDMIQVFFEESIEKIKSPITELIHVDEYLGEEESLQRKVVCMAFERVSHKLNIANTLQSVESWMKIFS